MDGLDSALDSLLASMNLSDRYAFMFHADANFDIFKSGSNVFGTLYKANDAYANDYSYVEFWTNGAADIIYGERKSSTGWKYLSLNSNLNKKMGVNQTNLSSANVEYNGSQDFYINFIDKNNHIARLGFNATSISYQYYNGSSWSTIWTK